MAGARTISGPVVSHRRRLSRRSRVGLWRYDAYFQHGTTERSSTYRYNAGVPENPAAQYNGLLGGNSGLQPEKSDTVSFGVMFQPTFVPNLFVSLDYFDIDIEDTISDLDGGNADAYINQCIATGDPEFCGRINRDAFGSLWLTPAGFIVDTSDNIASLGVKGIDIQASYKVDLGTHRLAFNLIGTRLEKSEKELVKGIGAFDCAGLFGGTCGVPNAKWRHSFRTTWQTPWRGLDASLAWRYVDAVDVETTSNNPQLTGEVPPCQGELRGRAVDNRNELQVTPFFAVPFGFARLEGSGTLNAELRALFLERAAQGARHANPRPLTQRNAQVFESEFQLFRWPEPCVQQLKDLCWRNLMRLIAELNRYDESMLRRILIYSDSWFHVTRRGGFFGLHNHPMATWSGVYCVSPGEHDADKPASGLLSFVNPAITAAMYLDVATANIPGPFSYNIRHLRLEAGQLVIFPSWVLHDVKPFEGEGERVTVSFNCWFSLKEQADAT